MRVQRAAGSGAEEAEAAGVTGVNHRFNLPSIRRLKGAIDAVRQEVASKPGYDPLRSCIARAQGKQVFFFVVKKTNNSIKPMFINKK